MDYDNKVIQEFIDYNQDGERICKSLPDNKDILYILNRDNSEFINRGILFAVVAHSKQKRKGTDFPYIIHPLEVGGIVSRLMDEDSVEIEMSKEDVIVAALLHDVIEDTDYGYDDIYEEFNKAVADLVQDESEDKMRHISKEKSWKIRKDTALKHLKDVRLEAKLIALADKLSNMRMSVESYYRKGDRMWDAFNEKDPAVQKWYYTEIARTLKDLNKTWAMEEYYKCLKIVFKD